MAAQVVPRIAMEIGSREALREAVVRGIGLGVVSEAEFIADPRIRTIRIEGEPLFTETYLYCLADRRTSRLITSFFDVVLSAQMISSD
jgi:DNA-binding transcriptional LysR family regulator